MVTEILKQEIDALREQLLLLEHRAQQLRAMLSEYEQELNSKVEEAKAEEAKANSASAEALAKAAEAQQVAISAMVAAKTAQESLADIIKHTSATPQETHEDTLTQQEVQESLTTDDAASPVIELYTPKDEETIVGEPELEDFVDTIDDETLSTDDTEHDEPQSDDEADANDIITQDYDEAEIDEEPKTDNTTAQQPWYGEIENDVENTTAGSTFLPPVSNIRDAISLGDRFLFQRELFNTDGEKMQKTLDELNRLKSFEEAMHYINKHFKWNTETQAYKLFIGVLKRRF